MLKFWARWIRNHLVHGCGSFGSGHWLSTDWISRWMAALERRRIGRRFDIQLSGSRYWRALWPSWVGLWERTSTASSTLLQAGFAPLPTIPIIWRAALSNSGPSPLPIVDALADGVAFRPIFLGERLVDDQHPAEFPVSRRSKTRPSKGELGRALEIVRADDRHCGRII